MIYTLLIACTLTVQPTFFGKIKGEKPTTRVEATSGGFDKDKKKCLDARDGYIKQGCQAVCLEEKEAI